MNKLNLKLFLILIFTSSSYANSVNLDDFNINILGCVKILQAVLPKLQSSDNASVVLFSTVAVKLGMPFHSSVSASKGAIEGLTRSLAA